MKGDVQQNNQALKTAESDISGYQKQTTQNAKAANKVIDKAVGQNVTDTAATNKELDTYQTANNNAIGTLQGLLGDYIKQNTDNAKDYSDALADFADDNSYDTR